MIIIAVEGIFVLTDMNIALHMICVQDVVKILREEYPQYKYPTTNLACKTGTFFAKVSSHFKSGQVGEYIRTNIGRTVQVGKWQAACTGIGIIHSVSVWRCSFVCAHVYICMCACVRIDNSKIRDKLGIRFLPVRDTIIDAAKNLMDWGFMPDLREKSLSPQAAEELTRWIQEEPGGFAVKDRKYHLKTYRQCFIGW